MKNHVGLCTNPSTMRYIFSLQNPSTHIIDIECIIPNPEGQQLKVQLPSWRPGRYELANFAKNIQQWQVFDKNLHPVTYQKVTKDSWVINSQHCTEIIIKYRYYAAELNAGSSFFDNKQLYVNPVNCCLYIPTRESEPVELELHLPSDYKVATSLTQHSIIDSSNTSCQQVILKANTYHELADSPFIASNSLQQFEFTVEKTTFYVAFQGECKVDATKIEQTFVPFIQAQFNTMGSFPFSAYHFLFQILPTHFYHGVEHCNSTVIALGPGYKLFESPLFEELLGVSCHELFHAWNIKAIRPAEMFPYDYTKENYSTLGYVCEGVTTYYGDYFLFRSGVFSEQDYFATFNSRLMKHFHNPARHTMPVAAASFDTWLDGYVPGIPGRKTSIYDEGCLLAFCTDVLLRSATDNRQSLDQAMKQLYTQFALQQKGYTDADYKSILESLANQSFTDFFTSYVFGSNDFEPLIRAMLEYLGLQLNIRPSRKLYESWAGFKVSENIHPVKVTHVFPDSPAEKSQLAIGSELIAINGYAIKNDLNDWMHYFSNQKIELTILNNNQLQTILLEPDGNNYYGVYSVSKLESPTPQQKQNYQKWAYRPF